MDAGTAVMTTAEGASVVLQLFDKLGPGGLLILLIVCICSGTVFGLVVLILWWKSAAQTAKILKQYGEHQEELGDMYKNNVELVKSWEKVAGALQTLVIRNTETMTILCESIKNKLFCPLQSGRTEGR